MKKNIILILVISLFLSGCGCEKEKVFNMDELADDNKYHYENIDLNFKIDLPQEFIYYQTQRKKVDNRIDIEFFVPTNDVDYIQEVPGYAKPIVVRAENGEYDLKFWEIVPNDWEERWSEDMENEIINSFEVKQ
ncbi:MAG: hypothetical protein ABIA02_02440 [Candidatus Falkowbacteria bacterium]